MRTLRLLGFLVCVTNPAHSALNTQDPFLIYEDENNTHKHTISVFTQHANTLYKKWTYPDPEVIQGFGEPFIVSKRKPQISWKPIHFVDIHWSKERPALGIARYTLTGGASGWMTFEKKGSLVDSIAWTHKLDTNSHFKAEVSQAADIATTAVQFSAEANPIVANIGLAPLAAVKLLGPSMATKYWSHAACTAFRDSSQDFGWLATGNNLIVLAGVGSVNPALLLFGATAAGIGAALISSEHHNGFWECLPNDLRIVYRPYT